MTDQSQEYFNSRTVTADEAVKCVKSGDRVMFAPGVEPLSIAYALAARKDELKNVELYLPGPGRELPWFDPGWEDSFDIKVSFVLPVVEQMMAERRCDYLVSSLFFTPRVASRPIDVYVVEVTPPDEHGFCSFGHLLWNKKTEARAAKIVIADVNDRLIRTFGDNFIHVSEIDYFVEHIFTGHVPGTRDTRVSDSLARKTVEAAEASARLSLSIVSNIAELVKDGDTIQVGVGSISETIVRQGVLDNKHDLGIHSEVFPRGGVQLMQKGVVNGSRKTVNPGKVVATSVGHGTIEDMRYINCNPSVEVHEGYYVTDPRVIAAHDNMVSINQCLSVDLTGQIAAESIGTRMYSGTGGQLSFAIGSYLSRGGRYVVACSSTAGASQGRPVSRIVPALDPATVVSVPRVLADYIVTEFGVARLRDKTQRERAQELIAISHPDFREDLRKAAGRLYWP